MILRATLTRRHIRPAAMLVTTALLAISAAASTDGASGTITPDTCRPGTIEAFLADYPLQKTNDYLLERTKGDPAHVNVWFFESGHLVKAGEDKVVRTNNDTFYKGGYADNRVGPVIVRIENPKKDRFVSLMVQDQRDFNVASIVDADGTYALVKDGQMPPAGAKPIRVTDDFHLCAIRVEVRNEADAPAALAVYRTATIEGKSGGPLDHEVEHWPSARPCIGRAARESSGIMLPRGCPARILPP